MNRKPKFYKNIIVGAGAAGLYCACFLEENPSAGNAVGGGESMSGGMRISGDAPTPAGILVLEKTARPGTKLLMAGSGQCNVSHGGSIKDFVPYYGAKGKSLRGVLQRHNNLELCRFLENLGVSLTEREDGKIFPASMNSRDVLTALLGEISRRGVEIRYNSPVLSVKVAVIESDIQGAVGNTTQTPRFEVTTPGQIFACNNLIIATGGCSYPTTGSDGAMLQVLSRDLGVTVEPPAPALTPVYVENYSYGPLSGLSFKDIELKILSDKTITARGDLLFTQKNLSGPVILNNSRYMRPGARLQVNFARPATGTEMIARFKKDFPGNGKSPHVYMSDELGLPRRFAKQIAEDLGIDGKKVSQLTGVEMKALSASLTEMTFTVNSLAGFKEAMVTKGGVSLEDIRLPQMESKKHPGLYFIGEVIDVDGDTGGYNLQFAYSAARCAADSINK